MASQPGAGKARSRDIFVRALDTPAAERAAFILAECRGDKQLQQEVEALLAEHDQMGDFLEMPAFSSQSGTLVAGTPHHRGHLGTQEQPGDHIDRYKLLQKIGEGGGGIVYMAEQEVPVRRRVALKVLKVGMDTKAVIARFEAERQALAMMEHPNIARVLDAGATDTGRPYFVMELVRGVRITEYCDENKLSTRERMSLFVQVCNAIQHAHQKGVIHRDIKPSNILVTLHDGVPVPKVIDFGIAKATEQPLTNKTLFTEFHSFIGTPAYMSPEQAQMSGLDIDTRSDIYSLGVLMYELLTGHPPFDPAELTKSGLDECRRTIREIDPARPSNRVSEMRRDDVTRTAELRQTSPMHLVQSLRGDLDWIVMKCLEKDRSRRYGTASDLGEDVVRYIDGDAILARPPSRAYRLRKLLRKHKGVVSAAAAITAVLLAGIGVTSWQAIRATKAEHDAQLAQHEEARLRKNAEQERQRAEQESAAARLNEYVADINLVQQSLIGGASASSANFGRALQLLHKHRPLAGSTDLRGFEWRYLWQLTRGDEHVSLPPQESQIQSMSYSRCGKFLAVGLNDRFNVWSLPTMTKVATQKRAGGGGFPFGGGSVSVAFLANGLLASADGAGVHLWNTNDWTETRLLRGLSGPICVSANGRIAAQSFEGVRVWDSGEPRELCLLRGATAPFALSSDGSRVVANSRTNGGLMVWTVDAQSSPVALADTTNLFVRMAGRADRAVAFSPDDTQILAARNMPSEQGVFVLGIWDARTGEETGSMPADPEHIEHTGAITCIANSPDGKSIATAAMDHTIRVWDMEKKQRTSTLQGHLNEVLSVAFAADGNAVASGTRAGSVKIWPIPPQPRDEVVASARLPLTISRDARALAALNHAGNIVFLDLASGQQQDEISLSNAPPPGRVIMNMTNESPRQGGPGRRPQFRRDFRPAPSTADIALSADLMAVAAIGERRSPDSPGVVRVWRRDTGEQFRLTNAAGFPLAIAMSPSGETLICGSWNETTWWHLPSRTNVVVEGGMHRGLFAPDGMSIAMLDREHIEIWDTRTRVLRRAIELAPGVTAGTSSQPAAFSPDGRMMAVVSQDDVVRIWDIESGRLVGTLTGHKQAVHTVAFAPDGKTVATGSDDSTIKFWNVSTQQELLTIRRLGGAPRGLMFSPDGGALIAGSSSVLLSGPLRIFRAPTLAEIDASEAAAGVPEPAREQ